MVRDYVEHTTRRRRSLRRPRAPSSTRLAPMITAQRVPKIEIADDSTGLPDTPLLVPVDPDGNRAAGRAEAKRRDGCRC